MSRFNNSLHWNEFGRMRNFRYKWNEPDFAPLDWVHFCVGSCFPKMVRICRSLMLGKSLCSLPGKQMLHVTKIKRNVSWICFKMNHLCISQYSFQHLFFGKFFVRDLFFLTLSLSVCWNWSTRSLTNLHSSFGQFASRVWKYKGSVSLTC